MSLYALIQASGVVQPALPDHCEPANAFLHHLSSIFHTCVPTNLALISTILGSCSIVAWLFAQLPQIWKNYKLHSTSGLSIFFLAEWLLGDASNLFGSLFTGQATWQIIIATYYCFVDCVLVGQYFWYEYLKHGRPLRSVWWPKSVRGGMDSVDTLSIYSQSTLDGDSVKSKPIDTPYGNNLQPPGVRGQFRMPRFSSSPATPTDSLSSTPTRINRITSGTSPAPSPRTIIYVSLVLALVCQASPLQSTATEAHGASKVHETPTEIAGRLISWLSTVMYLGSRLPQLYKNQKRRSTSGLSPALFIAAFFGNFFYSSSLLTNPYAWYDYSAYGGGGWAGPDGSKRSEWIGRAIPFFLGAAGVLFMDGMVGLQFLYFSDETPRPIIIVEERKGRKWKWRRVSGWMRGWMPSVSVVGTPRPGSPVAGSSNPRNNSEREGLLAGAQGEREYGGV